MNDYEPYDERTMWERVPGPARVAIVVIVIVGGILLVWRLNEQRTKRAQAEQFLQDVEDRFGGIEKFAFEDLPKRKEAAETFMKHVRSGRFDAAYAATTDAFRAAISRKGLEEMAGRVPGTKKDGKSTDEFDGLLP